MTACASAPELRDRLWQQLGGEARSALAALAAVDDGVFAVGGTVRDLARGVPVRDIDLAVEGSAPDLVASALPAVAATVHARFGTVAFRAGAATFDVVSARRETYARPGALPRVERGSIEDDLRRRDFSVNAIALRITGAPGLVDPCGGLDDLDRRVIRVLHPASFVDDPTRIYRAVRYATRLGFRTEDETRALLVGALRYVGALSGTRLRRELALILGERLAGRALESADALGALAAAAPGLRWDAAASAAFDAHRGEMPEAELGFALLCGEATPDEANAMVARLSLRRREATAVAGVGAVRGIEALLRRATASPSGIVLLLDRYPPASVVAYAATRSAADGETADAIAGRRALRYLADWRHVKPALKAADLLALGVPEGPQIERGLQLIRAARLDGTAADESDERALALRFASSIDAARGARGDGRTNGG